MKRRTLLVALAPLFAGCFSGTDPQSAQSTPAATPEEATPTPEPTPAPDPTPTPTDGGDATSDPAEASAKIDTARNQFREAVYIYSGGVSQDLLSVSAESEDFEARSILMRLYSVQTALDEAEDVAASEQLPTIRSLHQMRRFLTHATDLQASLIEGYDAVATAYESLEADESDDSVRDDLDDLERIVDKTSQPFDVVTEQIESDSVDATDAIDDTEFQQKLTQFEDERQVLEALHESLSTIQSARTELDVADSRADDGNYQSAADIADRVFEDLDETVDRLEDLDASPPSRAEAFEDHIRETLYLARDYAVEADDAYDRYR